MRVIFLLLVLGLFTTACSSEKLDMAALDAEMYGNSESLSSNPGAGTGTGGGTNTGGSGGSSSLNLIPASFEVMSGQDLPFSVSGGTPPYTYSVSPQSAGIIDTAARQFEANQPGVATLTVIDSAGKTGTTAVNVKPLSTGGSGGTTTTTTNGNCTTTTTTSGGSTSTTTVCS